MDHVWQAEEQMVDVFVKNKVRLTLPEARVAVLKELANAKEELTTMLTGLTEADLPKTVSALQQLVLMGMLGGMWIGNATSALAVVPERDYDIPA